MSEPARIPPPEAISPRPRVSQVLCASLPNHGAPASEQNRPCSSDSYAQGGLWWQCGQASACLSDIAYFCMQTSFPMTKKWSGSWAG